MVVHDRRGRVVVVVSAERVVQPAVVDEALEAAEVGEAVVGVVAGRRGHRVGVGRSEARVHEARAGSEHVHASGRQQKFTAERERGGQASSTSCDHFIRDLSRRIFSRSP